MAQTILAGKDSDSYYEPLAVIREAIEIHFLEYPSHGVGCACLDPIIWGIRRQINPLAFDYAAQNRQSFTERKARWSTLYVFRAAIDRG